AGGALRPCIHWRRRQRRGPWPLPLGVLEFLAGAGLAVLLALTHPGIAREQSRLFQGEPELFIKARQRTREPVPHRAGLPRGPAAADRHEDVELADGARDLERLRDDHPERFAREVVFERAAVHDDAPGPRPDPDPRDGRLATTRRVKPVEYRCHLANLRLRC